MSAYKYYDSIEEQMTDAGKFTRATSNFNPKHETGYKYNKPKALTGGSSDYYKVHIENPTTLNSEYDAECNDIIEALNMNFAEGNIFKAVWRMAASRLGNGKPGNSYLYDAEKIEFFAQRLIKQNKD